MVIRGITLCTILFIVNCEGLLFEDEVDTEPQEIYESFINHLEVYSPNFPYLKVNIDSVFDSHRDRMKNNPSGKELVSSLQETLDILEDANMKLILSMDNQRITMFYSDWLTEKPLNKLPDLSHYFSTYKTPNPLIEYGSLANQNIAYLRINSFNLGWQVDSIETVIKRDFSNTNGLIIDIRSVYLEYPSSSQNKEATELSDMFRNGNEVFLFQRNKLQNGRFSFSEWEPIWLYDQTPPVYSKPIIILTNNQTKDRAEYFIAAMKTIPNVTVVGDTTAGYLLNYWFDHLEGYWFMEGNGTDFRLPGDNTGNGFKGIYPDIPTWITESDSINGIDTILERAIELLTE